MILVDPQDEALLAEGGWYVVRNKNTFYVQRGSRSSGRLVVERLHRRILGVTDPKVKVDHSNGDGLDNRRANLRTASNSQNGCNRGANKNNKLGAKGVCLHKGKYSAQITHNRVRYSLGEFATLEQAAAAYQEAALRLHKDFANPGRATLGR